MLKAVNLPGYHGVDDIDGLGRALGQQGKKTRSKWARTAMVLRLCIIVVFLLLLVILALARD